MKKLNEETRQKLLQTAAVEFARSGYAKTNVNEVSVKAGFGKGTIYNYFKNKYDLFLTVFNKTMEEVAVEIKEEIAEIEDPVLKLKQAIYADFRYFEKNSGLIVIILRESYAAEREKQAEFIKAAAPIFELYMNIINEGIEKGSYRKDCNPMIATLQFLGMSENLILMQHALGSPLGTPEELAQTVMDTFIHGIEDRSS